jgi:hypothetical protein
VYHWLRVNDNDALMLNLLKSDCCETAHRIAALQPNLRFLGHTFIRWNPDMQGSIDT